MLRDKVLGFTPKQRSVVKLRPLFDFVGGFFPFDFAFLLLKVCIKN